MTCEHIGTAGEDLSAAANIGLCVFMDTSADDVIKKQTTAGNPIAGVLTQGGVSGAQVAFATKGLCRARAGAAIVASSGDSSVPLMVNTEGKLITATTGEIAVAIYVPESKDGVLQDAVDEQWIHVDLIGHNLNLIP